MLLTLRNGCEDWPLSSICVFFTLPSEFPIGNTPDGYYGESSMYPTATSNRGLLAPASPSCLMSYAALFVVCCALWTLYGATSQLTLGLSLRAMTETGEVEIVGVHDANAAIHVGSRLVSIGLSEEHALPVKAIDLTEEPDFFDEYPAMREFFERQSALSRVLRAPDVWATIRAPDGTQVLHRLTPRPRSVGELPFAFWFQCAVGSIGFLVGAWVLVFSPRSVAARLFALLSGSFLLFTLPAALYSTRALAIDGSLFRLLSGMNHTGAFAYGCALVAVFAVYPVPLLPRRVLFVVPAVFTAWLVLHLLHLLPNQDLGSRLPILLQMSTASVLVAVQWWATRGDPSGRAVVRWFGSGVIIGSSLFVYTIAGTALIGAPAPMPQGYAFGFFLLMDVGVALGLRRHQLLGLDDWALRALSWLAIAVVFVALDIVLAVWLSANATVSVSLSLLVCGFIYLPLRSWLWRRVAAGPRLEEPEVFRAILRVAFEPSPEQRPRRVVAMLNELFQPLEIKELDGPSPARAFIDQRGLRMCLPSVASSPALQLRYPWQGRRLFTPRQLEFAQACFTLLRHAETAREAFLRGVGQERRRIARELHDNLGAHLLSGLYAESLSDARAELRHAMADMRSVVSQLREQAPASLEPHLNALRGETATRLRAASFDLEWSSANLERDFALSADVAHAVTAIVRELVSNAIRHSQGSRVSVQTKVEDDALHVEFRDNGIGMPESFVPGNGWVNVRERCTSLSGEARLEFTSGGACARVVLPLRATSHASDAHV